MIRPPWDGVAFSEADDGDMRSDLAARAAFSQHLAVDPRWATVRQVHGAVVVKTGDAGEMGAADAIWTERPALPVAVFTADCLAVVLSAESAVGVAHAGWRGARSGVVAALRDAMEAGGHMPIRAAIGPGIGPCCFEVGPEVADQFDKTTETDWGSLSVDLPAAVSADLAGIETWVADACTRHEPGWFSHRKDGTKERLAGLGWLR
jgi:purine-nucleoside/S-methyl-5'-thioadenosine phosphorylase / adenosine deaminase